MTDQARSEFPCPVCGEHALAIDEPPQIDVMGVQQYSDILGMGDLGPTGVPGIVCLACGTRWRDREAFDRGQPETSDDGPEALPVEEALPDEGTLSDDTPAEDAPPNA